MRYTRESAMDEMDSMYVIEGVCWQVITLPTPVQDSTRYRTDGLMTSVQICGSFTDWRECSILGFG